MKQDWPLWPTLNQKQFSEKEMQFYLEIIICDHSICTIDNIKFIISNL